MSPLIRRCPQCQTDLDVLTGKCPSCGFRVPVGFFRKLVQRWLQVLLRTRSGKTLLISSVCLFLMVPAFTVLLVTGLVSSELGAPLFVGTTLVLMAILSISLCLCLLAFFRSIKRDDFSDANR